MPIYEYECKKCGKLFEKLVFSGDPAPVCPECGTDNVKRKLSSFAAVSADGCSGRANCPSASDGCVHGSHPCGGGCGCHWHGK